MRLGNGIPIFVSALAACYETEAIPPQDCNGCRGIDPPQAVLGTFWEFDADVAFVPLPPGGRVEYVLRPSSEFGLPLALEARGLCWLESSVEATFLECYEDPPSTCVRRGRPQEDRVNGVTTTHFVLFEPGPCGELPDVINLHVEISELEEGLCGESARFVEADFQVVPVCPAESDRCASECFGE